MIKVNGREVPEQAIQFELERLVRFHAEHGMPEDKIRRDLPILKEKATQQAIGARLLFDEAARLDLPVSEEEVEERLEEMKAEAGGEARFLEILKKQGMNVVELRNRIFVGRRMDKLVEKVTADVPEPMPDEVEAHFREHRDEYCKSEQVRAQHILVAPRSKSAEDKREAIAKIRGIKERIEAGADFASEAAAHSDCPSGKQAGGSLGWFSRGMMVKEFDDVAFSLPVGGMSDIIETEFGYHLVFKNDMEAATTPDFDEVEDQVRDFLRHARRGEALSAFVDELREKALVEHS
ncbi:MAG: peptidylprolyl isomerase [Kiritimatiellia bacterium]|jgi:parvulin-like peptidyl-prolyl isomerase